MPKDTAGSTIWTIGKLVASIRGGNEHAAHVEIPKFQRHLVWNDQQRLDLIDSIHRGYPIGSLLLFKRPNPRGQQDLFQVVDGLQRTSTLVGYSEAPLRYVPAEVFPTAPIKLVALEIGIEVEHVQRAVTDWMRRTEKLTFAAGFAPDKLAAFVVDQLLPDSDDPDVVSRLATIFGPALDQLNETVDIGGVSIPVVTYAGPEGQLPEIFERINQSGTKLSKYEVFAATWLSSPTQVNTTEIRVAINDKYNTLISRGFQISGLESDSAIQDFNLFEYLFGMGKWLVRNHDLLFKEKSDPAETEPAAFSLSCVSRGHQLSRMGDLPLLMPRADDGVIDPTAMEAAIATAADFVENTLRPYIALKLNSTTDSVDQAHGELHIVSMIARAVVGRYDARGDWAERPDWQADWDALRVALPQHYLMDLLEEVWRGPLYSLLFTRVWETDEANTVIGPSSHYTRTIDARTWDTSLNSWFEKQMRREQRSRSYVRAVDRVFLRFVYSDLVSHQANLQESFELEHLYPVSRLKGLIQSETPGWPISAISNLALFTKAMNREKSAMTISEHLEAAPLSPDDLDKLTRLMLCEVGDVVIGDGLTRDRYETFLGTRWATMKQQLLKGLKVVD